MPARYLFFLFIIGFSSCKTTAKLVDKTELKSGDRFTYRLYRDTDLELNLNGRRQISTNKQTFDLDYHVLEILPDGSCKYELTYRAIKIWQVNGFRTLEFDSQKDADNENLDFNQQVFQEMLGKKLSLTVGPHGEVIHLKGADVIIDNFFKNIKNIELLGFYRAVREQLGDAAMKEMLKQLHSIYPQKELVTGETWESQTSQTYGIGVQKNNTFLLKKNDKTGAIFLLNARVTPNPEAREVKMGNNHIKFSLKGQETGTYNLESANGRVKEASLFTNLSGTATITGITSPVITSDVVVRMETKFELLK